MIGDLVLRNRSCRRFDEESTVARDTLESLVALARLSPSAANLQPLRYILSCTPEKNARIFPHLVWAGYLKDWPGPEEGERPSAYVIMLGDTAISKSFGVDYGIAAQNIMLGAAERGMGGCMIGAIHRDELRAALDIAEKYEILLALALGWPKETVVLDEVKPDGDIKYWRDSDGVHHVPKRALADIVLG